MKILCKNILTNISFFYEKVLNTHGFYIPSTFLPQWDEGNIVVDLVMHTEITREESQSEFEQIGEIIFIGLLLNFSSLRIVFSILMSLILTTTGILGGLLFAIVINLFIIPLFFCFVGELK